MTNKRGAADLLLEIILSTIIFFVIVVFIFAVRVPQLEFQARATVVSSDAALACETSLTNLLRTERDSVTIAQTIADKFIQENISDVSPVIKNIFDRSFSDKRWELSIELPNGTSILDVGEVTAGQFPFTCVSYVPLPAEYNEKVCFWSLKQEAFDGSESIFEAPHGRVGCQIVDTVDRLGIVPNRDTCNLNIKAESIFVEPPSPAVTNDPLLADSVTLPLLVNGINYEITVSENADAQENELPGVFAELKRRTLINDCSLAVVLTTTNVSAAF
jgi:hypothetical protein